MPAKRWKVQNVPNELGGLAIELFRLNVEDVIWFLLDAYGKMWEVRDELE